MPLAKSFDDWLKIHWENIAPQKCKITLLENIQDFITSMQMISEV